MTCEATHKPANGNGKAEDFDDIKQMFILGLGTVVVFNPSHFGPDRPLVKGDYWEFRRPPLAPKRPHPSTPARIRRWVTRGETQSLPTCSGTL